MGKRILITGGTVFVSKFAAEYFVKRGYEVSVLNRGSRPQVSGVEWICADRNQLNGVLQGKNFDHVLEDHHADVTTAFRYYCIYEGRCEKSSCGVEGIFHLYPDQFQCGIP